MLFRAIAKYPNNRDAVHLAIAGYRTPNTRIPNAENVHDLGLLASDDVPVLLNSLDLAVIYNRKSQFGDYCFPQKFYEFLACQVPVIAANVGEMSLLLKDRSHLLYDDGDVESLVSAIGQQLAERELLDIEIPTWRDQAALLQQLMESVLVDA